MRKISTILFALFCVLSMSAKTFYLKPNSNWTQGNAWFAAYYFDNSTSQNGWVKMTAVANDPGVYTAEIDDKYPTVIFCRMNPASSALSWDSKWDQTVDLTVKGKAENCCAINDGQWNNANVTWSTYTPPTTIPDYYLTGTGNLVGGGGWSAKEIKMTYDDSTKTYSHTFVGLQAGEEYQMKVTTGTWDHSWGFANLKPAVENVTGSNDGNIVFEVQKLSDVTVTFDGTNISLEGKFGPAPTYKYELNGGLFNPKGWATQGEMCLAFQQDWNAYTNKTSEWVKLEGGVIKYHVDMTAATADGAGVGATTTWVDEFAALGACAAQEQFIQGATYSTNFILNTWINDSTFEWGWLTKYVSDVRVAQGMSATISSATSDAIARKEISAFFLQSPKHTKWPASADYTVAGTPAAFAQAWGYTFGNPASVEDTTDLVAPYKEGYFFGGWYDNAAFTGKPVTQMFPEQNVTLYAKWISKDMSVLMADLNVRRVLANNEGIYVLATDTNLVPTLVKADFAGQVQTIYNTDFCKAVGSKGVIMPLADIALTEDGVLLGINSEHVTTTKTHDQQPLIYKWNADGTGAIWIDTDDLVGSDMNFAAGNFGNATVDMLAYNGTLASGKLVTRAYTQGSGNRSRMGVMQITDTVATQANTGYNQDLAAWTATEGLYLIAAPTATDNFIWSGATCAPTEWVTVLPGKQVISAAAATMADTYMGAKGFTFATVDEQTIMTIPSLTGVKVLNVTAGIATATEVQDLVATAAVTEAACMYATVVEIEGVKKVLLARDLTIELLDLPEIPEQTTNLETLINNANDVKKVIINGNLYIIRNNAMYNVQGQMVK